MVAFLRCRAAAACGLERCPILPAETPLDGIDPPRGWGSIYRPFPLLEENGLLDPPGPAQRYCGSN